MDGPLQKRLDLTDNLSLDYNQNSFSISFIGLNYTNPVKNQYTWKLEGFEREWTPRISSNTATYTNIPPGHYNFRVRSTSDMNEWNGDERSIKIYIQPPFYRTMWAYFFYTIMIISVALMILQFMRIRYEEHHAKEKIQFFINVAHDLRTPLTLIQSPLSRITESKTLSETDKINLELAQKNAGKLSQLFNQLLEFQKADLNKLQVQIGAHDIVGHLKEVVTAFQPLLDKKKIACELKAPFEKLEVWYDELILDKIFYNLISNAIKYNKENGKIVITVKSDKSNCYIEVDDSGIGIPADQQKKVFRSYFRASNAINSAETGSGVGLMLVRHLVELHKGKIDFVSKAGEGTCFKIKIPIKWKNFITSDFVSDADVRSGRATKPAHELIHKDSQMNIPHSDVFAEGRSKLPKVLVVEDSEDLRAFLANSLEPRYRVYGACNGREALSVIEKSHPDLILSDVMMPEMDGNMLCAHLKQHLETCHIPVILLTALTDNDYKIEGYDVGADAYLEKPFDIKVISRIENLLRSRVLLKDKFLNYHTPSDAIGYKSKIDQDFIQKAVKIVTDNVTDPEFSVEEFCKKIFISRPVLYRKLKALTDQSPQDFIRIIRLKKAIEYMTQADMNINEAAYQAGFSDPKYFSTCFKKHYGKSPSSYLQENQSRTKVDM
jgi:signal transduction histidine kinase/AraC-like DNA-binding protein